MPYNLHIDNLSWLWCCEGHHRSGSYGNAVVTTTSSSASVSTVPSSDIVLPTITGGLENDNLHQGVFGAARSVSWAHGVRPQGVIANIWMIEQFRYYSVILKKFTCDKIMKLGRKG